jgi:hypothetical protein
VGTFKRLPGGQYMRSGGFTKLIECELAPNRVYIRMRIQKKSTAEMTI